MVVFFPNIMIGILWITIWAIISDFMMIEVEIIKISADFLQSQLKFAIFAQ